MGTRIQMAATTTGGAENALAAIDVPRNGTIVGVTWNVAVDFDTDNDSFHLQLSFGSILTGANDSRQVISNVRGQLTFTAGGSVIGIANYYDQIPDIPVSMGERLYVHGNCAAAVVAVAFCMVSFSFDLDQALVRRR